MNVEERALSLFRTAPYCYNCAQTICAAVRRMDLLEAMAEFGHGKAPEGLCGALYGALQSSPEEKRPEVLRRFVSKLGYSKCKELKREGRVSCPECVAAAASLAAEMVE